MLRAIIYFGVFGGGLVVIFRHLANYSSDIRHQNGRSFWATYWPFSRIGRDSTVEGYARQSWEFAQVLDDQAQAAMATVKERTVEAEVIVTEERTGG